jgi:hypothetical protein
VSAADVIIMSDEEFEALERGLLTKTPEQNEASAEDLYADLRRLTAYARYWRDRASEDPEALRDSQSTGVG